MKYRRAFLALLAVLTAISPHLTTAKCAAARYVISGRVHEAHSRVPVEAAKVTLLVNGRDPDPWLPTDVRPLSSTTLRDGTYQLEFYFDTFKSYSRTSGHDCSRAPSSITVTVSKPGFTRTSVSVPITSSHDPSLEYELTAPLCELERSR